MDRRVLMLAGVFLAGSFVAMVAGIQIGYGDYRLLGMIVVSVALMWILVRPHYAAMLAFGSVCPVTAFFIPVFAFSMGAVVVGICMLGTILRHSVSSSSGLKSASAFNVPIMLCCAYIIIRYSVNPVLPGAALGLGTDVSGFRVWANYWVGIGLLLILGRVMLSTSDLRNLVKFQVLFAAAFALALLCLIPVKALWLSRVLHMLGLSIQFFANGWRRFLVLPSLGIILSIPLVVPNVLCVSPRWRWVSFGVGLLCVIAGASRGGLLSLIVFSVVAMLLRRRYGIVVIMVCLVSCLLLSVSIAYRSNVIDRNTPFVRVFGLLDKRIAEETDGVSNMRWRMLRWRIAREDIRKHPWFGRGFGGIEGYFAMSVAVHPNPEQAMAEKDVAMGETHNGYISAARGFGVPFTLLFALTIMQQVLKLIVHARRERNQADEGIYILVAALLVTDLQMLLANMEFNSFMLWLHLGMAVLLNRFALTSGLHAAGIESHELPGHVVPTK